MVDVTVLKNATETVDQTRHLDVGACESRRGLLEHHLHRRWEERESDTEEPDRQPAPAFPKRMLPGVKTLVASVACGSTRPNWTLLAISFLISAVVVIGLRLVFGA